MKRLSFRLVLAMLFLGSAGLWAQAGNEIQALLDLSANQEESILLENSGTNAKLLEQLKSTDLNQITLDQMGNQNKAIVHQSSQLAGDPNLITVFQNGDQNFVDIYQRGSENALNLVQDGSYNQYLSDMEGELLLNTVIQDGNRNYIEQHLDGGNMNFSITQIGNGHEYIQTEQGNGIGYKVVQNGKAGMKVIVK